MKTKIPYTDMPMNEYEEYDLSAFTVDQLADYYDDFPEAYSDEFMAIYNNYGNEPSE